MNKDYGTGYLYYFSAKNSAKIDLFKKGSINFCKLYFY